MKIQELKKLVREEVKKMVNEVEYEPSYTHMKPFVQDIQRIILTLEKLNDKIEDSGPLSEEVVDAMEALEILVHNIKTKP